VVRIVQTEILRIFDENGNHIGEATRDEVHKKGYWHETFHCWLVSIENDTSYLYFQLRSKTKKDFPNLFDITAAGHILANETVHEGIREVEEELGIEVNIKEVISLGVIKNSIILEEFIDNELSHVFLLKRNQPFTNFNLQKSEVSGIVKTNFNEFYDFAFGKRESISVDGFEIDENDEKILIQKSVNKDHFVSHENNYLVDIVELIKKQL
jgi:isopentenyldiphosphate isomerase